MSWITLTTATMYWRPLLKISRTLSVSQKPYLTNGTLYLPISAGISYIYINIERFIAIDYIPMKITDSVEWYFFLDDTQVEWDDLCDEYRLMVRTSPVSEDGDSPGRYADDRYYTLEALS